MADYNYYEILGVDKSASDDQIKAAYRQKAKQYHPDLYTNKSEEERKNAEETFKKINHAYQVLSDPQKRAAYDQYGSEDGPQFNGAGAGGGFGGGFGFDDIFSNIFNQFGGGATRSGRAANAPRRGDDIQLRVTIDFADSVTGVKRDLKFRRREQCTACGGTGAKSKNAVRNCTRCNGTGVVRVRTNSIFGQVIQESVCPDCRGKGKIVTEPCSECQGKGFVSVQRTVHANIPAGIADGQTITYSGDGDCGTNGGGNGNLIVLIEVKPDNLFNRRNNDILFEMPISYVTAALGGEIDVPTPYGKVKYKIPEGTQTGAVFKIKSKGMKSVTRDTYGDLFFTVKVVTPTKLNKTQRQALEAFGNSLAASQEESIKRFNDQNNKK